MIRKMIVRQDIKKTILERFLIGKKLIDMKKHLNKKTICKRELKSYDYDETKLSELSLFSS